MRPSACCVPWQSTTSKTLTFGGRSRTALKRWATRTTPNWRGRVNAVSKENSDGTRYFFASELEVNDGRVVAVEFHFLRQDAEDLMPGVDLLCAGQAHCESVNRPFSSVSAAHGCGSTAMYAAIHSWPLRGGHLQQRRLAKIGQLIGLLVAGVRRRDLEQCALPVRSAHRIDAHHVEHGVAVPENQRHAAAGDLDARDKFAIALVKNDRVVCSGAGAGLRVTPPDR